MNRPFTVITPDAAAWIERHVIADYHLANEDICCGPQVSEPDCRCQMPCGCQHGQRQSCQDLLHRLATQPESRIGPFWGPETYLEAPTRWRPPNPRPPLFVAVWLADRTCRVMCQTQPAGAGS